MPADLSRRRAPELAAVRPERNPAFDARPRLARLRDVLVRAARQQPGKADPPVFFFDPKRQAELEAARPTPPAPFAEISQFIAEEMPALLADVAVRRVARATEGLKTAALNLAPQLPAAQELADLLAIPDDEVFVVLDPAKRTGVRLHLRGATDAAQLYRLLIPMLPERPFQLFLPTGLLADGTLPPGFAGSKHWLWPTQQLAAVPRTNGERLVLVGPTILTHILDREPRFPALTVECDVLPALSPLQVAERLSRLTGQPVPVAAPTATASPGPQPVAQAA